MRLYIDSANTKQIHVYVNIFRLRVLLLMLQL
ncbi:hypothetical protein HNR31_003103 [Anoxybacillus caldiproteolyticus]|uniref:Uncharacterized protein n=1 Tax=Thermaerobacillus caldiproteolyticus TaxID=247480 RepID=A0A7W0BZR3_9BACL|nr:hypothetical protein [Anoxybacillus caldiproteolyticus]